MISYGVVLQKTDRSLLVCNKFGLIEFKVSREDCQLSIFKQNLLLLIPLTGKTDYWVLGF